MSWLDRKIDVKGIPAKVGITIRALISRFKPKPRKPRADQPLSEHVYADYYRQQLTPKVDPTIANLTLHYPGHTESSCAVSGSTSSVQPTVPGFLSGVPEHQRTAYQQWCLAQMSGQHWDYQRYLTVTGQVGGTTSMSGNIAGCAQIDISLISLDSLSQVHQTEPHI